jgi:hypothetical protein
MFKLGNKYMMFTYINTCLEIIRKIKHKIIFYHLETILRIKNLDYKFLFNFMFNSILFFVCGKIVHN